MTNPDFIQDSILGRLRAIYDAIVALLTGVVLAAGTAIIGKVGLVDSGGSVALDKAEDAAHSSGDKGIMSLGVRRDAGITLAGTDGDFAPYQLDQHGGMRVGRPVFGEPSLVAANNSSANWARGIVSPLDQKSPTGWLACLYGGTQTGDDWARVSIPVDELLLTKLTSANWTYWMTNAETMGVNIVLWVHDATAPSKRAEITQLANVAGLAKAQGWNSHVLNTATTQFFYYGENTTGTALTAGTQYTLAQFQADALFSTWTIYRITLEYGWEASGTFEDAFVADLNLNGIAIPLKPDSAGTGRIAQRLVSVDTGTVAATIAPKTPYRLLSMDVHTSAVLDTGEALTLTKDAGAGTFFDTLVLTDDLFVGSRTSEHYAFGIGYEFPAEDEIDLAQANGSNDDLGITIIYQTVFS